MSRKGLNNDIIIHAAIELVEEKGYRKFAIRELAAKLQVKPASLYNHVSGIEELNTAVGLHGIHLLEECLLQEIQGGDTQDCLKRMADAYLNFAHTRPELYHAIIGMKSSADETLRNALHRIVQPFINVIGSEIQDPDRVVHLQRMFRSLLHGFAELEREGYLTYESPSAQDSFHYMVEGFLKVFQKESAQEGRV